MPDAASVLRAPQSSAAPPSRGAGSPGARWPEARTLTVARFLRKASASSTKRRRLRREGPVRAEGRSGPSTSACRQRPSARALQPLGPQASPLAGVQIAIVGQAQGRPRGAPQLGTNLNPRWRPPS